MNDNVKHERNKAVSSSPNHKGDAPNHAGGDQARKAQQWGGGNKGSKGPITENDKRNQNSNAKT